ncbi:hypothetical protein [Nonomuraea dietziae]|uniref:hypothetical protein n=1 Tax=Nonomuraea dietziae TaxID=65515 RepID=UPI0031D8F381
MARIADSSSALACWGSISSNSSIGLASASARACSISLSTWEETHASRAMPDML